MDRSPHIAPAPLTAAGNLDRCILALDLGTSTGWALRAAERADHQRDRELQARPL